MEESDEVSVMRTHLSIARATERAHDGILLLMFSEALGKLLGRKLGNIFRPELRLQSDDFRWLVRLVHMDGSVLTFRSALMVEDHGYIGVFSEHCGYYVMRKDDVREVSHVSQLPTGVAP